MELTGPHCSDCRVCGVGERHGLNGDVAHQRWWLEHGDLVSIPRLREKRGLKSGDAERSASAPLIAPSSTGAARDS